jgi:hypothetical protein
MWFFIILWEDKFKNELCEKPSKDPSH